MSQSTVNEQGNEGGSVTVVVPGTDVRSQLGALRSQHGAESPIGWHCTNILQIDENYQKETNREARRNMVASAARQRTALERLLRR